MYSQKPQRRELPGGPEVKDSVLSTEGLVSTSDQGIRSSQDSTMQSKKKKKPLEDGPCSRLSEKEA